MAKLINIAKPEQGGDPFKLWETLCEIIDALNDLTLTIVPGELASVRIQEGDIQISFNTPPPSADGSGGSQPTSGASTGDGSGSSTTN